MSKRSFGLFHRHKRSTENANHAIEDAAATAAQYERLAIRGNITHVWGEDLPVSMRHEQQRRQSVDKTTSTHDVPPGSPETLAQTAQQLQAALAPPLIQDPPRPGNSPLQHSHSIASATSSTASDPRGLHSKGITRHWSFGPSTISLASFVNDEAAVGRRPSKVSSTSTTLLRRGTTTRSAQSDAHIEIAGARDDSPDGIYAQRLPESLRSSGIPGYGRSWSASHLPGLQDAAFQSTHQVDSTWSQEELAQRQLALHAQLTHLHGLIAATDATSTENDFEDDGSAFDDDGSSLSGLSEVNAGYSDCDDADEAERKDTLALGRSQRPQRISRHGGSLPPSGGGYAGPWTGVTLHDADGESGDWD
ncbi:hypothetical protein PYCC9005_004172 [Savitreella phatthalungensis]